MSYFSIAAPQSVQLPDGTSVSFRVNAADTSQVEIHISGERDGSRGTWMLPFKRNGSAAGSPEFHATAAPQSGEPPNKARIDRLPDDHPLKAELTRRQEAADAGVPLDSDGSNPLAGYASVDDDAVRHDPRTQRKPGDLDAPSVDGYYPAAGDTKVDPVHGKINTVGADAHAGRPKEGTNADTPIQDRKDQAAVGIKPARPLDLND